MVLDILIALLLFFVVGPLALMLLAALIGKCTSNTKSSFESPAHNVHQKAEKERREEVAAHNAALAANDPELRRMLSELTDPDAYLSREDRHWLKFQARGKGAKL